MYGRETLVGYANSISTRKRQARLDAQRPHVEVVRAFAARRSRRTPECRRQELVRGAPLPGGEGGNAGLVEPVRDRLADERLSRGFFAWFKPT